MAKTRQAQYSRRLQVVFSKPRKTFKERYLTAKGQMLLKTKQISKTEAWERYGKNRYVLDPKAKPVRNIHHNV